MRHHELVTFLTLIYLKGSNSQAISIRSTWQTRLVVWIPKFHQYFPCDCQILGQVSGLKVISSWHKAIYDYVNENK